MKSAEDWKWFCANAQLYKITNSLWAIVPYIRLKLLWNGRSKFKICHSSIITYMWFLTNLYKCILHSYVGSDSSSIPVCSNFLIPKAWPITQFPGFIYLWSKSQLSVICIHTWNYFQLIWVALKPPVKWPYESSRQQCK